LESIVRSSGAVPASIGVLNGIARVGVGKEDLIELASSQKKGILKVSRRDIGYICGLVTFIYIAPSHLTCTKT